MISFPMHLSREVERLFDEIIHRPWGTCRDIRGWNPSVDLYETEDTFLLEADLPGVKAADVEVEIENHELVLRGSRLLEQEHGEGRFRTMERSSGHFMRRMELPESVDKVAVKAEFHDGVLRIIIPNANGLEKSERRSYGEVGTFSRILRRLKNRGGIVNVTNHENYHDRLKKRRNKMILTLNHVRNEQRVVHENKDWIDRAAYRSRVHLLGHLADWYAKETARIDKALIRIAEGKYGVCMACGKTIEPRRLETMPEAVFCAACQPTIEEPSEARS